jgi:hypothetical protein
MLLLDFGDTALLQEFSYHIAAKQEVKPADQNDAEKTNREDEPAPAYLKAAGRRPEEEKRGKGD